MKATTYFDKEKSSYHIKIDNGLVYDFKFTGLFDAYSYWSVIKYLEVFKVRMNIPKLITGRTLSLPSVRQKEMLLSLSSSGSIDSVNISLHEKSLVTGLTSIIELDIILIDQILSDYRNIVLPEVHPK